MSKTIQTQAKSIASKGWDVTLTVTGASLAVGGAINTFNLVKAKGSLFQILFSVASVAIGIEAARRGYNDLTQPKVVAIEKKTVKTEGGEEEVVETVVIEE